MRALVGGPPCRRQYDAVERGALAERIGLRFQRAGAGRAALEDLTAVGFALAAPWSTQLLRPLFGNPIETAYCFMDRHLYVWDLRLRVTIPSINRRRMRTDFLVGAVVFLAVTASLASGEPLAAQVGCAYCKDCKTCEMSDWGATDCNFKGTKNGKSCCQLVGDLCNPAMFLPEEDIGLVPDGEKTILASRLEANVFGSWGCASGALRAAYRRAADGEWTEVAGAELAVLRENYPLTRYIEIARLRVQDQRLRRQEAASNAVLRPSEGD